MATQLFLTCRAASGTAVALRASAELQSLARLLVTICDWRGIWLSKTLLTGILDVRHHPQRYILKNHRYVLNMCLHALRNFHGDCFRFELTGGEVKRRFTSPGTIVCRLAVFGCHVEFNTTLYTAPPACIITMVESE